MADCVVPARRLYDAFAERDPQLILESLHPDFVGHVSAGMPLGVGGVHRGPQAMLAEVWGPVFAAYEMRVEADELLPTADGRVVALGHYRGSVRATGEEVDAAFAHVLRIDDDRISELRQITDTTSWVPQPAGI